MKTLIKSYLAVIALCLSAVAEQPVPPAVIQAMLAAPTIALCPQNLRPGDQAVLIIISRFQKDLSKPIQLKEFSENSAIEATEVFQSNDFSIDRKPPNSAVTRVYRITLKAESYKFTPSDFSDLPPGFKLPELRIYREKK